MKIRDLFMARPGRKPILNLDEIEYKEQLFQELSKFVNYRPLKWPAFLQTENIRPAEAGNKKHSSTD